MYEGTEVGLPGSTAESALTAQVTDHVTHAEFQHIVQNGNFDATTQRELQNLLENWMAMPHPEDKNKIINRAIDFLYGNPTNKERYQRILVQLRGSELPVRLPDGQEVRVAVGGSWRVGKLKALLSQKTGGKAEAHKLFAGARELRNEKSLAAELLGGQTLSLRRADSYELFVDGPSSQRSISISPNADVQELRAQATRINGIPDGGRLTWNGMQLQDGRSLRSYGINAHSRVALTPRLTGG